MYYSQLNYNKAIGLIFASVKLSRCHDFGMAKLANLKIKL